jgi:hypothetical protein
MNLASDYSIISHDKVTSFFRLLFFWCVSFLALWALLFIQQDIDLHRNTTALQIEELRQLPRGEHLKPVLLGYHHLAADLLWLRVLQIIGARSVTSPEYEWLYHALDVITTLDPQYDYAYQVGGIILTEFAQRVDLSNRLYIKGIEANPNVWQIPFYLGFNYFFYLHDDAKAAEYMTRASKLPGHPLFLPFFATRLAAEAGNPEIALSFLGEMWRQTHDEQIKAQLETRMKELVIERDVQMLQTAVERYTQITNHPPRHLGELVSAGILSALPGEPFGGEYRYNAKNGEILSSTHPERLRIKKRGQLPQMNPSPTTPSEGNREEID